MPVFAQKKKSKTERKNRGYSEVKKLIESNKFQFVADYANTQKGRNISLFSNPNYVKFDDENVAVQLPYFGVVQSTTFDTDGGMYSTASQHHRQSDHLFIWFYAQC